MRPAGPAEYAAAGALTAEGYLADGLLDWQDGQAGDYEGELRAAADRAASAELLVAVDPSGLLGTVTWCPVGSPQREVATSDDQGEFRMLAVSPAARRRGVGRSLVRTCLDRAAASGMSEVLLCSLPEMTNAHALYLSFGFVRSPELDWSPAPGVNLWGFRCTLPHVG